MNQFIGKQFDQYQIGPLLGEGGMAAVFHAHDLKNNRPVALKIMLANLTNKPHFRQRFQQEAAVCASFNSPAIVKIYGSGEVNGFPYIAMEYIEGGSLSNYVNQMSWGSNDRLPLAEVLALSAQIAEGLAYAHQRGLVHRDIKPANILLKLRDGATGSPRQAVISDFGLAVQLKTVNDAATNPFMGSLAYMSPEQCENSGLDGRSDIYALGILLYELATGQLPFQINAPADIVKHINETPLPPRLINPQLPQPVEDIILKAIAKKPNERYQTAAEMAHALRQLAADESLLTAVPLENQNAVTQWLENRWVATVNVQDRVDTSKTWTSEGRYRLFVTSQHEESKIHGLNKPVITIGRSAANDIVLEDRTVSAHHISLNMRDNGNGRAAGWSVRDLGSTNGSYLGDRALAFDEDVVWKNEDVLRIGPYHLKWQLFSGEEGRGGQGAGIGIGAFGVMAAVPVAIGTVATGTNNNGALPAVDFDGGTAVSSSENLSIAITPETAVLEPETDLPIDITITNTGITVQEVNIHLFDSNGTHPIWIQLSEHRVKLLPEESASLTAIANLPADFRMDAGKHRLNVQATSDRGESETAVITLIRPDSESFTLDIHPSNLQEDVACRVTIRDESNFDNGYTIMGIDDADALLFDFAEPQNAVLTDFGSNQQSIRVAAQSEASTSFTIRPKKRPLFGNDKPFPFKVRVRTQTTEWQTLTGQVDIHSRISRRLIIFLMLLTMLLCLLGFGVYSMVAADREEQQLANQAALDTIGATATAAQAGANAAFLAVENAQATANALSASGDVEGAANAQATADALEFGANATQAAINALQKEIDSLTAAIGATATPPPPPTSLTLSGVSVGEDSPIGTSIGSFTASSAAFLNTNPAGLYANKSTGASRLFRTNAQSAILFSYTIVGGDADAFFIDGDVLKTAVLFDFETQNSYKITVLADNGFNGTLEADFTISINDVSDTPQLTISNLSVDEGDGTAVLTVLMTGSTQSEVTVEFSTSDGTAKAGEDYKESGDSLTWAPGESGEREIEIALIDDDIKESAETFTVTLAKAVIAAISKETAVVTISDDESPPTISIAAASGKEGDGEIIVIVTMTGKSSEDVTVAYATKDGTASKASDYSADNGQIVWKAGSDGDIEIAIGLEDDEMDEPSESLSVVLSNAVNATIASGIAIVTIEDDDDAPTLSIESAGPFAENAGEATLTVVIKGSSSQEVEVSYATSDDTTTVGKDYKDSSGTITWPAESTSAQQITVPILSDSIFEGEDELFIVTLSAPVNATIAVDEGSYAITDDDSKPSLSITDISVNENSGSAVLTVVMSGGSSTDVTVEYTTVDGTATVAGGDYGKTASPPVLTWPANALDGTRKISVVINNDDVDEGVSETFLVNLLNNSANSIFLSNSAKVTITDNDTAAITVDPTNATISEPSTTANFKVTLGSRPTAAVTVPLSSSAPSQCTVPASVVINPSDWATGVSVTISPVNDDVAEDTLTCQVITGDPTSGDGIYDAFKATDVSDVTVTVNDEDIAGVVVTLPASLTISETTGSNTGQFTIKLRSQPAANATVTIPLRSLTTGQCTIAQTEVVILATNWNTTVPVIVTAVDENDIDNSPDNCEIDTGNPTSTDPKYDNFVASDVVNPIFTIANDDLPGAAVSPTSLTITETTPAVGKTFSVILSSRPTAAVTFAVSVNNDCKVWRSGVEITNLTIAAANWNTGGVPVTVTATDDAVEDGTTSCTVSLGTASSTDTDYDGVIDPVPNTVAITVLDDDAAGIDQVGTDVSLSEDGTTGNYTFVLTSEPTDAVTIAFNSTNSEVEPIANLVFTPSDWNVVRTVTVTAVNDNFDEGPHSDTISHTVTSADAKYNGYALANVAAAITDNDTAGVTIIHSSSITDVSESGASDSYGIVLNSQPRDDVTIGINNADGQLAVHEGAGQITSITIIPTAWNVTRTLTITAVNDPLDEAAIHTGILTHSSSSSDSKYNPAPVAPAGSLTINIADDDRTPVITPGQTVAISETAVFNTTLIPTLTVDDDDPSPFIWEIVDVDPLIGFTYFYIANDTLTLAADGAGNLDYESQQTYTMTLRASDGTNRSANETVIIRVDDVDDEPPLLITNNGITVDEGDSVGITTAELDASDPDTDNNTLLFSLTAGPTHGQIMNGAISVTTFTRADLASGFISYLHDSSDTLTDTVEFDVQDGSGNNLTGQTLAITITPVDDLPPVIAANAGMTVDEGTTTAITSSRLSATDAESDDLTLTFTITTTVQNGRLQLSSAPGITITSFTQSDLVNNRVQYVHDGSETTADSFTFDAADVSGNVLSGQTFSITVTPVNDAPVANADTYTVTEGIAAMITSATGVLSNDTDVDTALVNLTAVSPTPAAGTLNLNATGAFTYTSIANSCGTDNFTYRADDNESANNLSSPAAVSLNIICVDDPPTVATNALLTAPEGLVTAIITASLSANDIDTANSGIVFAITTAVANGRLQLSTAPGVAITTFTQADLVAGIVQYAHNGDEPPQTDSFVFTISDNTNINAVTGTFDITITAQPDPPVLVTNAALTAGEEMTTTITTSELLVTDDDTSANNIVFAITTATQHGFLQLSTARGAAITDFAQADLTANRVEYVHNGDEPPLTGDGDTFIFTVSDGIATLPAATFHITVTPVNDPPVANDDPDVANDTAYTVLEGSTLTPTVSIDNSVLNNDIDVDSAAISLTAVLNSTTLSGTLDLRSSGIFTYTTTNPDTCGTDSFTYRANDNAGVNNLSDPATVTITITCVDDPPTLVTNSLLTAPEGMTTTITTAYLSVGDIDTTNDKIIITPVTGQPQNGFLQLSSNPGSPINSFTQADLVTDKVQYVHDGTESPLTDSFVFTYQDETNDAGSQIGTFAITITPVNDAPVAIADSYTATEGIAKVVPAATGVLNNDTDVDTVHASLTAVISDTPTLGNVVLSSDGGFTYTSNANSCGTDNFTYKANDGVDDSNPATVTITITCVDDPPTVVTSTLTAAEGLTTTITTSQLDGSDIDTADSGINFTITTGVLHGFLQRSTAPGTPITSFTQVDLIANRVQYVHDGSEPPQTDSFIFSIGDGTTTIPTNTFNITITPVNDPPIANSDSYTATEDIARVIPAATGVLFNDTDVEGDVLTAVIDTPPSNSSAFTFNNDGSFSYAADTDYCGTDSFTYHADDGDASNIATVNLTINCVNDPPTTVNDTANATGTSNTDITVLDNDTDTETNPLDDYGEVTVTIPPISGTANVNTELGLIRYKATTAITGTDIFTYQICDDGDDGIGGGAGTLPIECSTATVTINLTVASAEPTIFVAQADDCEGVDSCLRRNDITKPLFVLSKQGGDGVITAVLTHQELIAGSDTVRLNMYISLQNGDGSPNADAVLMETAVLLADGTLYPAIISQEPSYTIIAVDSSDSMKGVIDLLQNAAAALVDGLSANSSIAVMRYDENIDLIQPFSNDRAVINNALASIQIEENATCTYDAVYAGMQALLQTAPNSPNRALILVSDGVDRDANGAIAAGCSNYTEAQAIAYANANAITIHVIGSDGVDNQPVARLVNESGGTVNTINAQSPAVAQTMLNSFNSQWIASAAMQPAQGLQRGVALLTLADGTTPSPVPVQFVSPRDYVVEETAVSPQTIDISNFRYDDRRDRFEMDVALSNLSGVQVLRVELLDASTNVQTGLSVITQPQFSQRVAIAAAGLTADGASIAHAYTLNSSSSIVRDENGNPVEAFYTFQHTPANQPPILTIETITVEDKAAKFDLGGINLENDPPKIVVTFELKNGDGAATLNGRLLNLDNNIPSETFTVTATIIGDTGTATIVRDIDEGRYTLVLNVLDENGRSAANDDAQFNYTIPDGDLGRAAKALVNNPLLWLLFLAALSVVAVIVWNSGQRAGKKKAEAGNVALNSPLTVAELVEDETVAVQLSVVESPDSKILAADGTGKVWQINHFPFTIGRDGCDLNIANDPHVSRKHAQIVFVEGDHFIEDLGSANGTFLNATKLSANKPISLSPERGERITIGKTTTLSFDERKS